jgi:RND family efflux transporter MFP subunit
MTHEATTARPRAEAPEAPIATEALGLPLRRPGRAASAVDQVRRARWPWALGLGCTAVALAAAAVAGAQAPAAPGPNVAPTTAPAVAPGGAPEVRTVLARAVQADGALRLPARTEAIEEARLFARTSGVVLERRADLGDSVAAGAVLARIAAPEVDQALDSARASLAQAQARERLASATLERNRPLVAQNFVSPTRLDDLAAALDVARADTAAAAAEVRRFEALQGFQTVRAPFAGVIVERLVERGDRVSADGANNTPALFRLARLDALRVVVDVPQSAVAGLVRGRAAEVRFSELGGLVKLAQVERMAGRIDPATGAMRVELTLPNPGRQIPAGLRGEVLLAGTGAASAAGAVAVPANALQTMSGQPHVATLDAGNRLRFVPVEVRRSVGRDVELSRGLAAGTRVVLNINALLQEGQLVRPVQPS